jgi:hypothetical protein
MMFPCVRSSWLIVLPAQQHGRGQLKARSAGAVGTWKGAGEGRGKGAGKEKGVRGGGGAWAWRRGRPCRGAVAGDQRLEQGRWRRTRIDSPPLTQVAKPF